MNYQKYKKIKIQKKLSKVLIKDIPHRKLVVRKLATIITREEKNNLGSPVDYSKNKVREIE